MDKRISRLEEISNEIHDIANSFAGDETGTVAASLHGVAGRIRNGVRMLKTGITLEDRKEVLREHFKNQIVNKNKSPEEIEHLVEMFSKIG